MRATKDSKIKWVRLVPSAWKVVRGKYCLSQVFRPVKDNDEVVTCFRDGQVTLRSNRREEGFTVATVEAGYQGIEPGDLIVHGMDGFAGAIGISDARGKASPVLVVLETKQSKRYIKYYLRSAAYSEVFLALATGIRVRSCDLRWNKLAELDMLLPPLPEQECIADFLDTKCAEIDALTADIQAQIDTLEQYKRSIIIETVTRGLNPDAEMKDSGIEWIGDIPSHWNTDKLKYHLKRNEPRNPGDVPVLSLYRDLGVVPKDSRADNHNVTSEDTSKYKYVHPGNFVINKMKAWQGSVAISEYEGIVSPAYFIYEFTRETFFKRYFHYLLRSCYKDEFMRLSDGIRVGQWDLPAEALENIPILIPPTGEQQRIADFLDTKCAEIEALISDKQKQLVVLNEYKKSLIFEYVTGKKEVLTT